MKKVLVVVPHDSMFRKPILNGFKELGYQTDDFDYRNLLGNLRIDVLLSLIFLEIFIIIFLKFFSPKNLKSFQKKYLNGLLLIKCYIFKPSFVFVVKGEGITKKTVEKLNASNINTINWMVDPVMQDHIWSWFKEVGPAYEMVLLCEEGRMDDIKKLKWGNKLGHMLAAGETASKNLLNLLKKYDLTFVGTYNPEREKLFKELINFDLHIWGYGWENSNLADKYHGVLPMDLKTLLKIYAQSKIVLATTQTPFISVNNRVFEAASMGAMVIMEYNKFLPRLFKINQEIVVFKNKKQLLQQVKKYLNDEKSRQIVAKRLQKKVLTEHTYKKRLQTILKQVGI